MKVSATKNLEIKQMTSDPALKAIDSIEVEGPIIDGSPPSSPTKKMSSIGPLEKRKIQLTFKDIHVTFSEPTKCCTK